MTSPQKSELENYGWMHVYAQGSEHDEVIIRGTLKALMDLRDELTKAIETRSGESEAFASDGEGYRVKIQRVNMISSLGSLPYVDHYLRSLPSYHASTTREGCA